MPRPFVSFTITITRSVTHRDWAQATLRKQIWSAGVGTRSRAVATAGFYCQGMAEHEIIEGMLRELLAAYIDQLS